MKSLLSRLFPENRSACRGGMCAGDPVCPDRCCPGHPATDATYLHLREPEPKPAPREFDWQLIAIWIGVAVAFGAVIALSSRLGWAQLVALMAF